VIEQAAVSNFAATDASAMSLHQVAVSHPTSASSSQNKQLEKNK
jgi:hypothetical protein